MKKSIISFGMEALILAAIAVAVITACVNDIPTNPFLPKLFNDEKNNTRGATVISSVDVIVTAPAKGSAPHATATTDDTDYNCGTVSWSPEHNSFLGGTVYTATVTLSANEGCVFASELTAAINDNEAEASDNTGKTVTLSLTFDATLTKTVTNISIKNRLTELSYTHGDMLDLAGLVVTLAFDDGTSEDMTLAHFGTYISTHPANGAVLHRLTNNNQPVTVHYGELTAETENLTVNKAAVSSVTFPASGAVNYGDALSSSILTGGSDAGSFAWVDGAIIPTVNNSGYDVEFTPGDTDTYNYSGVPGWNSGTGKVVRTVSVTVNPAPIINVDVTVIAPAKASAPDTIATVDDESYTCGAVSWSPVHDPFRGNTKYTATVTLTAKENHTFAVDLDAAINNDDAAVTNNTGEAVTLSLEFDATLDKIVSGILIKTQPALSYTHGDTLDLDGLVVTLDFDDSTSEDLTLVDFGTYISTHPANGAVLHHLTNNNHPVIVSFGELTADTNNLTVNAKALTVTGAAHTKPYDGTTSATGVTVTLGGVVGEDEVSAAEVTAEYTNAAAGTHTINITAVTLTGQAAENYTVTPANGITVTGGGITKANPTVTWPTNLTATYGQTLANISLPGNGTSSPAGAFTWTTPGTSVGSAGTRSHSMTFTPTDTANYNTLTQGVNITVNKINPTVTWPTGLTATYGQTLANISLPGNGTGSPAGTFTWTTPSTSVGSVGTRSHSMTFTPNDTANYNTLTQNVNITVNKANPTVSWPTGLTAIYGQTLANISLPGNGTSSTAGTFTWTTPGTSVGSAGTNKPFSMTFTPTDTANYNTLTQIVSITVNKAIPTVTWPTGLTATYGQTLANISLSGKGTSNTAGTFTWTTPSTSVGNAGTRSFSMTFTPNDTANYNTLTQGVNITVNKINPAVTWPTGLTATYGQTLSNISLPSNGAGTPGTFTWTTPSTFVGPAGTRSFSMIFIPNDPNYNAPTQVVNIIVRPVEMVWVAGGSFQMGQNGNGISGNETPVHTVTLSGFYIGKYEVTQAQYQTVMGTNPSYFTTGADAGEIQNRRPVEQVSWYDALVFCNKLSMSEGLTPAYSISGSTDPADWEPVPTANNAIWNTVVMIVGSNGYRLPTEAQWEYAAKGGHQMSNPPKYYSGSDDANTVAWYYGKTGTPTNDKTHEVGKLAPNELGIYDMSGNVYEQCWDRYNNNSYPSGAQTDPVGESSGYYRIGRGGHWGDPALRARSVLRYWYNPDGVHYALGFRLVRPAQ